MGPRREEEEEEEEEEGGQRAMQEMKIHGTEEGGELRNVGVVSVALSIGQAKINSSNYAAGSKISNGLHSRLLNRRRRNRDANGLF